MGAPAAPVSSNPQTHDDWVDAKQQIMDRAMEEIPIEVVDGQKKFFIKTNGANEIDFMQPSRMPFDARLDTSVNENVYPGLYKFLETVSANTDWHRQRQSTDRRPLRRIEITGDSDGLGQPAQNPPVVIFDNNSGSFGSIHSDENPQPRPPPPPPPLLPSTTSGTIDLGPQPGFIAEFSPIVFSEYTDCMFNEEIRSRPPFPIYNYDFDQMNAIRARELNDRTGIEGAYIINNRPAVWN